MKSNALLRCLPVVLMATCVSFAPAQDGLPTAQPARLTIIREKVKPGQGSAHARHEAGWPAAYEKAGSPDYYISLTSMTGPMEALYLIPFASHAAEAESMKRDAKDPVLSAELDRLATADGAFISDITTVQLTARPDLSFGKFPSIAKVRYFEFSTFSVRQGHEATMDSLIKTYNEVRKRTSPDASYRFYTVSAGMPDPTYVVISSVADYAEFDRTGAEHAKVFEVATPEEQAVFAKRGEAVMRSETNRYRLDPMMSYVSKDVRATDPDFWSAK